MNFTASTRQRLRTILANEGLSRTARSVVKVIVFGGKSYEYDREEIQEMLDNPRTYQDADNLPKWILSAGLDGVRGFPKNWKATWAYLEALVAHQGSPVTINVRSDERYQNKLPRL